MAHVQIHLSAAKPKDARVMVDGIDITRSVMAEGFAVTIESELGRASTVSMVVAADTLDVDLPDAVLQAMRASESAA
ncbi:MAG: hypothetical protein LH630_05065 [Actinomycetia bacterium]|nr:hypothetical protein [Actinomycetes bacterium]